jgi:hypothetical protein
VLNELIIYNLIAEAAGVGRFVQIRQGGTCPSAKHCELQAFRESGSSMNRQAALVSNFSM